MGIITVDVCGSFKSIRQKQFLAEDSGHAVAAEDAIRWLEAVRREALAQDRELRLLGSESPKDGWAEFDKRHPLAEELPADVIAERVFSYRTFDEPLRFSHCNFISCLFRKDCIFTDCLFEGSTVRGELLKCNLTSCEIIATVFVQCKAQSSDVTVCHVRPSWEDFE